MLKITWELNCIYAKFTKFLHNSHNILESYYISATNELGNTFTRCTRPLILVKFNNGAMVMVCLLKTNNVLIMICFISIYICGYSVSRNLCVYLKNTGRNSQLTCVLEKHGTRLTPHLLSHLLSGRNWRWPSTAIGTQKKSVYLQILVQCKQNVKKLSMVIFLVTNKQDIWFQTFDMKVTRNE